MARPLNAVLAEGPLSTDLLDALDAEDAATELLVSFATTEAATFTSPADRSVQLTGTLRLASLQFVQYLCEFVDLPLSGFFDAATLLDVYVLKRAAEDFQIRDASWSAACVAVVLLTAKKESDAVVPAFAGLGDLASSFASWLCNEEVDVTMRAVLQQERTILGALAWRTNIASVLSWLVAFGSRVAVLSHGSLAASSAWALKRATSGAHAMFLWCPVSTAMPPRRMANGLFCLSLVSVHLMPLDSLRPEGVSAIDWEALFRRSQWLDDKCEFVDECTHQPAFIQELLAVAMGSRMEVLRADTCAALETVTVFSNDHQV